MKSTEKVNFDSKINIKKHKGTLDESLFFCYNFIFMRVRDKC
ncbi:hypothetical protein 7t3_0457 [Salmonella phage 7t3]|nr:hypothetical protein 7t3_0457 [Salmonella phage 7t3]